MGAGGTLTSGAGGTLTSGAGRTVYDGGALDRCVLDEWGRRKVTRRSSLSEPHGNLKHIDPLRRRRAAGVLPPPPFCPPPSNPIPFVGKTTPPPHLPHLPIWEY